MAWTDTIATAVTGEIAPASMWNAVRDNFALVGPHLIARKTADEVISSTTQQADNHLILPLAASEVWEFRFKLYAYGTGDFKYRFTMPTSAAISWMHAGNTPAGAEDIVQFGANASPTAEGALFVARTTAPAAPLALMEGMIVNSTNAGNLTLEWACNSAGTTTLVQHSTLWAVKLA